MLYLIMIIGYGIMVALPLAFFRGVSILNEEEETNFYSYMVVPLKEARLCVSCNNIVREPICPICLSKQNILIGRILGKEEENGNPI